MVIENIRFDGIKKTRPAVIQRYLTFQVGDSLEPAELLRSNERLSQTDFFKYVDIYTAPGSQKGQLIVIVEVDERKWPHYRFEGGHSDLDGWYVIPVSFRFDNFFGRRNYMGWQWKIGSRVSGNLFSFRRPNAFGTDKLLDMEFFTESQDFIYYQDNNGNDETVSSVGIRAKMLGTTGKHRHFYASGRFVKYIPQKDDDPAPFLTGDSIKTGIVAFGAGAYVDRRDNTIYPMSGYWGSLYGELSHGWFGSEVEFLKMTFDFRTYQKISEKNVFAFRMMGGYTGKGTPFYERFYLGGSYSLRGYPFGRITPSGWGTKLLMWQTELRFPLSEENFPRHKHTAVLFYEGGGIWLPNQTPDIFDFYYSLGFGYRVKLRYVGIVRIDLGYPLRHVSGNYFQFHLSFGHAF